MARALALHPAEPRADIGVVLNRLPTPAQLPAFSFLLDDIGRPSAAALARALGVSPRAAARWIAGTAEPPRPVALAVWWLTRYGQSVAYCEAVNAAALAGQQLAAAEREIAALRAELARVLAAGDFGCANDPTLAALPPRPAAPLRLTPIAA